MAEPGQRLLEILQPPTASPFVPPIAPRPPIVPAPPSPTKPVVPSPPGATWDPTLEREQNIGPWTLGALAAGALGVVLARRPGAAKQLSKLWQKKLPAELDIIGAAPKSPVITETERMGVRVAEKIHHITEGSPWRSFKTQTPTAIKDVEHTAVMDFLGRATAGTPIGRALTETMAAPTTPDWLREVVRWRASRLPVEQAAKRYLGLQDIPERWGPYLARQVERDVASLKPEAGLYGELRTSLGGFQRAREYPTMRTGEAAGATYVDPRIAWMHREIAGVRLVETARFLQRLENRVVFRSPAAARAASPTGEAFMIEDLPGQARWWTGTLEERKFLLENLRDPKHGQLGFLKGWMDTIARNPNLLNPLPHFTKNMLYKYGLSLGRPRVFQDMQEFFQGTAPLVQQFKHTMPFEMSGKTSGQIIAETLGPLRREQMGTISRLVDLSLASLGRSNSWSSRMIFTKLDPALRYARWKQYVQSGMHPMEAANHTWVDLVRYGTRSDAVDFWKAIPMNFFVPWRLGTVTSVWKQLRDHPIRATAFIGAVELLREIRYRRSGRWTHLPIDYITTPIAHVIQSSDPEDARTTLLATTFATLLFGPGGGFAARGLTDTLAYVQSRGELDRLLNMFWGVSQIYDGGQSAWEIATHLKNGNLAKAGEAAQHLVMTAAFAEHSALNYRPRRLLAALPEVGRWLTKSVEVKLAERAQQTREKQGRAAGVRRERLKPSKVDQWLHGWPPGDVKSRIERLKKYDEEAGGTLFREPEPVGQGVLYGR